MKTEVCKRCEKVTGCIQINGPMYDMSLPFYTYICPECHDKYNEMSLYMDRLWRKFWKGGEPGELCKVDAGVGGDTKGESG